jgi:predicted phage tail protein
MSVLGIYADKTTVSDAISVMQKTGYRLTDISVLSSENQGSKDFGHVKRTKALEGAATGAAVGALLGAALGWLVGNQTVTITILAPLVAAGPVLAAIAGAGAGGAVGWLLGLLAGQQSTEYVSSAPESAADYGTTDKPTERAPAAVVMTPVVIRSEALAQQVVEPVARDIKE